MLPTGSEHWIWISALIPPTVATRTICILSFFIHFFLTVFVSANTRGGEGGGGVFFSLMLLKTEKSQQIFLTLFHFAEDSTEDVVLCLCPWCWLWSRQQWRSCPRCLKSIMLTGMSAACRKHSACVRSFLLNHWDIICACLMGYSNCVSSISCWVLEHVFPDKKTTTQLLFVYSADQDVSLLLECCKTHYF